MSILNGSRLLSAAPLSPMMPTKERAHGVSFGLAEAGIDIRVKQTIRFVPPDPLDYWEGMKAMERVTTPEKVVEAATMAMVSFYGMVDVDGDTKAGRVALASSVESFHMPDDLLGIVHDKSTWARQGVSVLNTVIEPGWGPHPDRPDEGCFLTLEIVFHGNKPITIPAGAGIAQVIFHEIGETARYGGKYTGQPSRPVAAILEKG